MADFFSSAYDSLFAGIEKEEFKDLSGLWALRKNWGLVVGEALNQKTRPFQLKSGKLTISVTDSAYGVILSQQKDTLLPLIISILKDPNLVKTLTFQVADYEQFLPPLQGKAEAKSVKKDWPERKFWEKQTEQIQDQEVRTAFLHWLESHQPEKEQGK